MEEMTTIFTKNECGDLGSFSDNDEDGAGDAEEGDGVWNEDVAEEEVDVAVGSDSSDVAALSNQISGMKVV
jgi:hypothetical protein